MTTPIRTESARERPRFWTTTRIVVLTFAAVEAIGLAWMLARG